MAANHLSDTGDVAWGWRIIIGLTMTADHTGKQPTLSKNHAETY